MTFLAVHSSYVLFKQFLAGILIVRFYLSNY